MAIFAKPGLLANQHLQEGFAMLVLLEFLEQGFLRLRHRAADTMALPLKLAHIDARARRLPFAGLGHVVPRTIPGLFHPVWLGGDGASRFELNAPDFGPQFVPCQSSLFATL